MDYSYQESSHRLNPYLLNRQDALFVQGGIRERSGVWVPSKGKMKEHYGIYGMNKSI